MNKPWVIWSLSALCAALIFGAMGAITHHTLKLEKKSEEAYAKAQLEEKVRLAMWRMDSVASAILAKENNRPAWHFLPIDRMAKGKPTQTDTASYWQQVSPLNLGLPDNVKLHFEARGNDLFSPQSNDLPDVKQVGSVWAAQSQQLSKDVRKDWQELNSILTKDTTYRGWQAQRNVATELPDNNLGLLNAVAQRGIMEPEPTNAELALATKQRAANPGAFNGNSPAYQGVYNQAEKQKRQEIVDQNVGKRGQVSIKAPAAKEPATKEALPQMKKNIKPLASPTASKVDKHLQEVLNSKSGASQPGMYFTPLRPVWIGGELLLVREVSDGEDARLQGVWLDAQAINTELLGNITDLLSHAKLVPVKHSARVLLGDEPDPFANDPMVMAALPWKLVPGEQAQAAALTWTPLRKTLALAWLGALFAAVAAIVLFRGVVKLSERRASFVSSVTHELRTPLTTFGLYSDMLAEGMVADPDKKQEYLETLRRESGRLTHLVENVLAYSRIEKGSARARKETLTLGAFAERINERLGSRAQEAEMEWKLDVSPEVLERSVELDTTAAEQIIFNLVDNAAKYAQGGTFIELSITESRGRIIFCVRDDGPGIKSGERRRLFRAFHKSATEAAHTKPGVGLGLALSRRLARALGGDLRLRKPDKGAAFELIIKAQKSHFTERG